MLTYREILDNSGLIIFEKDENGKVVKPTDFNLLKKCNEILNNTIKVDDEYYNKKQDKWYNIKSKKLLDREDNSIHTVTYITDISNYKRREKEAQIDNVTNLYNRSLTNKMINEYILKARDNGGNFSIIMGDLDEFKLANDIYGHLCGDKLLKEVSNILLNNVSKDDVVGRFGGDEFLLLLKNSNEDKSFDKACKLKNLVENMSIIYDNQQIPSPTMSIGIYNVYNSDLNNIDDIDSFRMKIYRKVDQALYYSKNIGKNMVTDYNNIKAKVKKKERL